MRKPSTVVFIDDRLEERFESLEDTSMRTAIIRTIRSIEKRVQIPKRLIPKRYASAYGIANLWKHDLPSGWRLLYTIASDEDGIVCAIIDWFDHKRYERVMGY